ncbi:FG-GAP-like repeat-containing protein, partial [Polaribacter sp. IC063]|uniref:FG-GAP-like repeat-containing protein n=1 Tax=Polaribacter sp. IC063 TaxID=57031 RepID=UPI0011C2A0FE
MNKKYSFLCIILLYTCANIFAQAVTINGNHSQKSVTKKQNVGQNNEEHITKISNKTKSFMGSSNQASTPKVGIWYSTWHAKENNYLWVAGHGRGSSNQFLADVNGDGKADAVAFFGDSGEWYVSLSNGEEFEAYTLWVAGHGTGSSNQILADVNGDGKDDAAVFFNASGEWYVSLSSGTGFGGYSLWTAGHGTGSTNQFLADVNGDGKADAVVFADNVGEWNVAVSNGTRFGGYSLWTAGHGTGSTNQFLKDVNGDGKADAVVFAENVGDWNVSVSTGSGFAGYSLWRSGDGVGSKNQFISDVDGDGKGDAVLFFDNNTWFVSLSNGTGFKASKRRLAGHGVGSTNQFLGDVTGDGNSDAVIFDGNPSAVEWYVMSDLTGKLFKPNMVNTWQAWNMDYLPISKTRGHYQYDNLEEDIVDEHIEMIVDAGIDFIIFDATNNLEVDGRYILNRAEKFIERVQIWNNAHKVSKQLKYSFAIGGSQFNNNINTLIIEANYVYDNYFSKDPDNYYITAQNKPLLSNYSNTEDREKWLSSGQLNDIKNKFDLQWIKGGVDEPGLYGWANSPAGPIADNNVMVVMPGWRNGLNSPGDSPRDNGAYYLNSWAKVLEVAPKTVIINSFNEYAERTALAPSGLTPTFDHINDNEKWRNTAGEIDDYFYWRETVRFIKIFRGCAEPVNLGVSNISTTTVDLSWNTVPTADNGYEWLVMAAGVAPNTATAIAAGTTASGTTTAQAAGLSESTEYETYVRANCDTGVSSSWSRVVSFITASTFKTWTGAINNNWTTTGNWNTSVAPLLDDNIVIPNTAARQPVIGASSGVSLNNLDIATVASLSITSGGSLIVKGTATGNITYNLAIPDNNWHLVSSPVVGEQYNNTWVTDNLIPISANFNRGISTYDNSATFATGRWSYFKGGTTETFNAGIGYSMLRSAAGNFSFTGGFPTTNEISPAISQNDNSWNLLGNPYPSYIDIAKFIDANTLKIAPAFRAIY